MKIEITCINGKKRCISARTITMAPGLIWDMYIKEKDKCRAKFLHELHSLVCAIKNGSVTYRKEDDSDGPTKLEKIEEFIREAPDVTLEEAIVLNDGQAIRNRQSFVEGYIAGLSAATSVIEDDTVYPILK